MSGFADVLVGRAPIIATPQPWRDEFTAFGVRFVVEEEDIPCALAVPERPEVIRLPDSAEREGVLIHGGGAPGMEMGSVGSAIFLTGTFQVVMRPSEAGWYRVSVELIDLMLDLITGMPRRGYPPAPIPVEGDLESRVPPDTIEVLVDLARQGSRQDFDDLARMAGVAKGQLDGLWVGTRARLGRQDTGASEIASPGGA